MKLIHLLTRLLPALSLVSLSLFPARLAGQAYERSNQYQESYRSGRNTISTSNKTIQHKTTKWWHIRESSGLSQAAKDMDTFDDVNEMTRNPYTQTEIQPAHVYVDTIYMEKGSSIQLTMPTKNNKVTSVRSYQRWYNYRTEGTFRTNQQGGYNSGAYDLLIPSGNRTAYRFQNGYVGNPLVSIETDGGGGNDFNTGLMAVDFYFPTDNQFNRWGGQNINPDNNLYIVACDASSYLDFRNDGQTGYASFLRSSNNPYEPTLGHRVIFYIYGIDSGDEAQDWPGNFSLLSDLAYRSTGTDAKYLEEYDIVFPFTRTCNNTNDVLALSKDAQAWDIPGVSGNITVSIENNSAGIALTRFRHGSIAQTGVSGSGEGLTMTGAARSIHFTYPNRRDDGTRYVDTPSDGSTPAATVVVRKGGYNLARYRLTFLSETQAITQQQVANLDAGRVAESAYWNYPQRTPKYLREHYRLLTSLDWDYDDAAASVYYGDRGYYPFPMQWDYSSYAFYDGSERRSATSGDFIGQSNIPQWGYYAIMDGYNGVNWVNAPEPPADLGKDPSTYHVYVDASDRPGTIARLTFPEKLCSGSELFVSAWLLSSASQGDSGGDDSGVLFTVMGVNTAADGQKIYTPIYRHASGQIANTTYLNSNIPGCGSGKNQWMQVYFSFINEVPENAREFEEYCLQIDNNCASTSGGDFFIDDVQVYIQDPTAEVAQLRATCTGENTLMTVDMDWDRLASRMGDTDVTSGEDAIDFCFIDKTVYDSYLAEHPGEEAAALQSAVVELGPDSTNLKEVTTFYFRMPFTANAEYNTENPRDPANLAAQNVADGKYYFRRIGSAARNDRALKLNFFSALLPYRPYYMLIREHNTNSTPALSDFVGVLNDACGMYATFNVGSETLLKVNGEVMNPTTDFCVGQIFNFSAQLRVPYVNDVGEETYFTVEQGAYFDWFFGTGPEFLAPHEEYGGASLQSALLDFRAAYPDAEAVDEKATPWGTRPSALDPTDYVEFTEQEFNLLKYYSTSVSEGLNAPLVLHKERLDISIQKDGLDLVVCPIQTVLPPAGLPEDITQDEWAAVCWNYIPMALNVTGEAPELHAGVNTFYPSPDFNPALRIGLRQLEAMSSEGKALRVSLRGAKLASKSADNLQKVTSQPGYDKIYLVWTNDPNYSSYFTEDFDQMSLPIGEVKNLFAEPYGPGSSLNDHADISFDLTTRRENGFQFTPREGYTYTFSVHFEERSADPSEAVGTACYGQFNVDMKVVPEYVVWKGEVTDNWNNDLMWRRADAADFRHTGSGYTSNADNGTDNAFVPMLFTKVIVPQGKRVELYRAGVSGQQENGQYVWDSSRPDYMGPATENIEYDLMTYENASGDWTTERYRVTLCDQIQLESGAELLHGEQLIHNKAWTDVELTPQQWILASTPLIGVHAGDWYTQTTGRQTTEYFQPITFTAGDYNRVNPAVFQRTMSDGARIVEEDNGGETPVFFGAAWSSVYNDASVSYAAGAGFSLSAMKAEGQSGSLLFRLPKDDNNYDVATGSISRPADAGKLAVSRMLDRSNPNTVPSVRTEDLEVTLTPSADGRYFLVGNPFPAHLDVNAFLQINSDVLVQKYWMVNDNGPIAGSADAEGNWTKTEQEETLLPPYGAFYAERAEGKDGTAPVTVRFTADMQSFAPTTGNDSGQSGTTTTGVRVTAQSEGGQSTAVVTFSEQADNGFAAAEDAQLLRDESLMGADQPYVYTVAGTMAAAVNRVRDLAQIPLGVFAAEGKSVMLTFTGLDATERAALYDAELQSERPLHEGDQLSLTGSSHGRYFLRLVPAEPTGIAGVTDGEESITVYSVTAGEVIASAPEALTRVEVYDTAGRRVRALNGTGDTVLRADGLTAGTYVVRAATASAQRTVKLVVE